MTIVATGTVGLRVCSIWTYVHGCEFIEGGELWDLPPKPEGLDSLRIRAVKTRQASKRNPRYLLPLAAAAGAHWCYS